MYMMDMIEEAQELCEKARVSVATEDCMDAAYKLCDLQVLLVRMEYEAKAPVIAPPVQEWYRTTCSCSVSEQEAPRFDNMPNPTPTVTQDPAQTHVDALEEWGDREAAIKAPELNGTPAVTEEVGETGPVEGEVDVGPVITDLRDSDEPAHTPEVTAGSRFTLGGILGRH